jgi:hypothetical protein
MKVNLFIIGAAKSGSTSLYQYLNQHPDIYFSPIKETNYFAKEININDLSPNYKKNNLIDLKAYFSQDEMKDIPLAIIQSKSDYEKLFHQASNEKILAEASVSYMYSETAADAILEYNPTAKFIAILRNPIERAFSHYLMALRFGYTSLPFKQAFESDMNAAQKGWGVSELFYELGLYSSQLHKYYERFPKSNIRIFLFEDLIHDKQNLFQSVFEFLEIKNMDIDTNTIHNPGEVPRYPVLNKLIYRAGFAKTAGKILPDSIKNIFKQNMLLDDKPVLSAEDRKYLKDLYEPEILKTQALIQRDLSHWLI